MLILFKILLAMGFLSCILFMIEVGSERMTLRIRWKDLTKYQWFIALSVMVGWPIGLVGLLILVR